MTESKKEQKGHVINLQVGWPSFVATEFAPAQLFKKQYTQPTMYVLLVPARTIVYLRNKKLNRFQTALSKTRRVGELTSGRLFFMCTTIIFSGISRAQSYSLFFQEKV